MLPELALIDLPPSLPAAKSAAVGGFFIGWGSGFWRSQKGRVFHCSNLSQVSDEIDSGGLAALKLLRAQALYLAPSQRFR
jgi:hypothetical protein